MAYWQKGEKILGKHFYPLNNFFYTGMDKRSYTL